MICWKFVAIAGCHNIIEDLEGIWKVLHHIVRLTQAFKLVDLFNNCSTVASFKFAPWYSTLMLHSFNQSSFRGQTFQKPSKQSVHWTNRQMKFWWGWNFNYRHFAVEIIRYSAKVYYISVVFCLFLLVFASK